MCLETKGVYQPELSDKLRAFVQFVICSKKKGQ